MVLCFLSLTLFIHCIIFIIAHMLNHLCVPRMNPN
jgi:hypothetical protein